MDPLSITRFSIRIERFTRSDAPLSRRCWGLLFFFFTTPPTLVKLVRAWSFRNLNDNGGLKKKNRITSADGALAGQFDPSNKTAEICFQFLTLQRQKLSNAKLIIYAPPPLRQLPHHRKTFRFLLAMTYPAFQHIRYVPRVGLCNKQKKKNELPKKKGGG